MSRKKRKQIPDFEDRFIEQDERFAYIAGYTPAGFPYGVTWEEEEEIEKNGFVDLSKYPEPEEALASRNQSEKSGEKHPFDDIDVFELPF